MSLSTLTSKFQTTIPKDVRDSLSLQAKDQLSFTVMHDGTVMMRAKRRMLTDLSGIAQYTGKPISTQAMRAWQA